MKTLNYYVVGGLYEREGMPEKVFGLMNLAAHTRDFSRELAARSAYDFP